MENRILSRQQLYDQVWSMPMLLLAKQFQLSDNGLRKICRKYSIPIPQMGYWQKLKFGKPTKKIPLPQIKDEEKIQIKIYPRNQERFDVPDIVKEIIAVPDQVLKFHPLVKDTRQILSKGRKDRGRLDYSRGQKCLDIRVSPEQFSRACRIAHSIINVIEQQGAQVVIEQETEWKCITKAVINGEKVSFGLDESLKIVKLQPDKYNYSSQEFVPNGKLLLRIDHYLRGCRTKWTEGEIGKIEDKITSFINGLWAAAACLKKDRLEREEEKHRWEEQRKENERKQQELEEEKRRFQILDQQVSSWQKSRNLRAFIRAVIKKKGVPTPDSELAKWVEWANAYAERLDPLRTKS